MNNEINKQDFIGSANIAAHSIANALHKDQDCRNFIEEYKDLVEKIKKELPNYEGELPMQTLRKTIEKQAADMQRLSNLLNKIILDNNLS